MTETDISHSIAEFQEELGLPVTDALSQPIERLVEMVLDAFPVLRGKTTAVAV